MSTNLLVIGGPAGSIADGPVPTTMYNPQRSEVK